MNKAKSAKKSKPSHKLIYVAIAAVAVIVLACASIALINIYNSPNNTNDNSQTNDSYVSINSDELSEMLARPDIFYLYVGRTTCPHCAEFSPILREVISSDNVLVYYYDTAIARAEDSAKMNEILDKLSISSVPTLTKISGGARISTLDDYASKESISTFLHQ